MTNKEAIFKLIEYRRMLERNSDIDAEPFDMATKALKAQQWIPCSERLPSYGEDVLLSIGKYANVGYLVQVSDDDGRYNWFYSGWYHSFSDVDAWMPLPEAWKGEEDE